MRLTQWLVAAGAATGLVACNDPSSSAPPVDIAASRASVTAGIITSAPAQAVALAPGARLIPLLTSGDIMPGSNLPWAPTPDGLGAYQDGKDVVLFANHEITAAGVTSSNGGPAFQFSRVSRLRIDPFSLHITDGSYAEDGSGGYIRLCSATWVSDLEGFPTGYFFTGEENGATSKGSITLAFDGQGRKTELPHLGALSHENTVAVPGFRRKVVTIGTDDSQGQSELYMYVAENQADFIAGRGKFYVFKSDALSPAGKPMHSGNLVDGQSINGYFVEISDPADLAAAPNTRYARLQSKVDSLGAFPFVRLEDADYVRGDDRDDEHDRRDGREGRATIYFVDTGNETVTGRTQVGADCGGVCDVAGSLYRMTLDRRDPTKNARLTLVLRSKGVETGWASPDNVGISRNSIMIMEDPAYSGWNGVREPGIWNARLREDGRGVGQFREVVKVTQESLIPGAAGKCVDASGLCWETSGVVSTEDLLGRGTWLFDVQAHTLPFAAGTGADAKQYSKESGQLLYLRLPGS